MLLLIESCQLGRNWLGTLRLPKASMPYRIYQCLRPEVLDGPGPVLTELSLKTVL